MRVGRRARSARGSPRRAIHAVMMKSVAAFMTAKRIAAKGGAAPRGAQPSRGTRGETRREEERRPVVEAAMALLAAAGDATESAGRTVRPQGRSNKGTRPRDHRGGKRERQGRSDEVSELERRAHPSVRREGEAIGCQGEEGRRRDGGQTCGERHVVSRGERRREPDREESGGQGGGREQRRFSRGHRSYNIFLRRMAS